MVVVRRFGLRTKTSIGKIDITAKSIETNFSRPSLPPLLKSGGLLAHTTKDKANTFATGLSGW